MLKKFDYKILGISVFIAFLMSFCIYFRWIPFDILSKTAWAILLLFILFFTPIIYRIISKFVLPYYPSHPKWINIGSLILSLISTGLLMIYLGYSIPDRYIFLPHVSLEIINTGEHNPVSKGNLVEIKQFDSGITDSFKTFTQENSWTVTDGTIFSIQSAKLKWTGRVFKELDLTFKTGPDCGIVKIRLNGVEETFDLYNQDSSEIYIVKNFPPPIINRFIFYSIYWLLFSFFIFLLITFLITVWIDESELSNTFSYHWWVYAIPMILIWGIYLLTFWPGMMSPDSVDQWQQMLTGHYNDWHPVIYALCLGILSFGGITPALVALGQIVAMSLVISWGIDFLRQMGVRKIVTWLTSMLFAVSPVCGFFSITLWKDIPYSICMLALFLIFLKIILTDGYWFQGKKWLTLGLVGAGVILFRHNGLPVAIAGMLIMMLAYHKYWKLFSFSLVTIAITVGLVLGPLYSILKVERNANKNANKIYLHYISAHVFVGTPLSKEEEDWINQICPTDEWIYDPCNADTIRKAPHFNANVLNQNSSKNLQTFISLTKKAPMVSLQHALRSSNMIWRIARSECYLFRSDFWGRKEGYYRWIDPGSNQTDLKEDSKLPWLVGPLYQLYTQSWANPILDALIWRSALSMYWTILVSIILALRFRRGRYLLIGLITELQSGLFLFITFTQHTRYQFGVILIGLFCFGLLFLPKTMMTETKNQSDDPIEEINR